MTQQTAVEFLVELLPQIDWNDPYYRGILQEAKDMEKEQIVKAYHQGTLDGHELKYGDGNQYYNETYGKE